MTFQSENPIWMNICRTIQYTLFIVYYVMYTVHCSVCIMQFWIYGLQGAFYIVTVQRVGTVCSKHCTANGVQWAQGKKDHYGTNQWGWERSQNPVIILNAQYLRGTRMVSVYRSTFCPRSQMPAGVQKCHSYLLIPPGSPGISISGRGNARNIEFWGNFPAHSHIFDICNTHIWRHIRIALDFFSF